ncbi:myelin-associated glycoprotein-like [Xiphophorus hellerii]|uniref:myelin-associated glycoprotein-like n=1 Tax=Xiphophorus hellerii TaxID=8084 RepID=UPI0013B36FB3|nr:myelin-associated glycoprotein-like [Xiphophorus hellerii]
MLALIWVTLLCSTTGMPGLVQSDNKTCEDKTFTLPLKPTNQTAAAGQYVVLECSLENKAVTSFAWCKNGQSGECNLAIFNSSNNSTVDSKILGRVTILEPDLKKKNCSIIITNLTTTDTGVYQVKAEAANGCTYLSEANITIEVQERNITLEIAPLKNKRYITLTCSVPAVCSGFKPQFTWTYQKAGKTDNLTIIVNNTEFLINMMDASQSHTSSLTFKASSEHHSMNVTCRVGFPGNTSKEKTLNTSFSPRISNSSGCQIQSNLLTCVCISEGFPSPNITWPLLNKIFEYSLSTNRSALSVTSNMTVSLEQFMDKTVECVSSNNIGETKESFSISEVNRTRNSEVVDIPDKSKLNIFSHLVELFKEKMISVLIVFGVGFLTGSLITTLIACLATKCHRNKKKSSHLTDELELVNTDVVLKVWDNEVRHVENNGILDIQDDGALVFQDDATLVFQDDATLVFQDDGALVFQDDGTLVFQDDGIQNQAAAECGEELPGDLTDSDMSPKETVYSDLDFSALKTKNPADAKEKEDTKETEYAEIMRGEMEEAQENEGMDCEMLEGNDETEVMMEHQEEAKQIVVAEELVGETDPLY